MVRSELLFSIVFLSICKSYGQQINRHSKHVTMQQNNGYAPVNGISMYYEIHGRGNALVLVHGGGSTI